MTFPTIYLLRHGQTEWNVASRLQGKLDSKLTETGRAQAENQGLLLRPIFEHWPEIEVISSPLGRAMTTAQIATEQTNIDLKYDSRLREMSAGSWDGCYLDDIERLNSPLFEQARNAFELMFLAPDGEGERAVFERCKEFLSELSHPSILITHGATLCVLRGILRNMTFEDTLDLSHEQGCIYAIENGVETILR